MSCECTRETKTASNETRIINVDFLFLDNDTCVPCGGTSDSLDQAMAAMKAPLAALGAEISLRQIHVATKDIAIEHSFLASPTIRINGVDIEPEITEDECETCGTIAGSDTRVDCRTWHWQGQVHYTAPVAKIMDALMQAGLENSAVDCCAPDCCDGDETKAEYALPANLNGFFETRGKNAG